MKRNAILMAITALYVVFIFGLANSSMMESRVDLPVTAAQSYMGELTDEAVDTFAMVYAKKVLGNQEYVLTVKNRENIKSLLGAMGANNIEKLNEATYSGNTQKIIETVESLVAENFGWEETALMEAWQ